MNKQMLIDLGLDSQVVEDRVVEHISEMFLHDANGHETDFNQRVQKLVNSKLDEAVEAIAKRNVLPNLEQYVEDFCLQETSKWGEKKGERLTFTEYLVKRAGAYMAEPVNYAGKTKSEDSYTWKGTTTRVVYLINEHLRHSVSRAMQEALKTINKSIAGGLEAAVKIQMGELKEKLRITFDGKSR